MSDHAIDDYLLDLIRGEVQRAAKADTEFATAKARREYGLRLIRSLPADIDWSALEASFVGVRSVAPDSNLQPKAIIARLEKKWRQEQNSLQMQTGGTQGMGR